jgi:hypothetical protein
VKIQDFTTKHASFLVPWPSVFGMAAYGSSPKKNEFHPILYKNSPWTHIELKFDELGVAQKLMKYVV